MEKHTPRSQADLKYNNLKLIYDIMREGGPLSRVELARRSGLSMSSITRIVSTLCENGLMSEESIQTMHRIGRPAILLMNRPGAAYCLCIDVMAGTCKVAVVDLALRINAYRELTVSAGTSFEALISNIAAILPELAHEAGTNVNSISCCGVSVAGHVIMDKGIIANSGYYHWLNVEASAIIREKLGLDSYVENDCKAALVAEAALLTDVNGRGRNVVYVVFNKEGVGCACMINGQLLRGSRNAAGELGHINVWPETVASHIYLEEKLTQAAIIERAKEADASVGTMEAVVAALDSGNEKLAPVVETLGRYIAAAVNTVNCMYNPDTVILNGVLMFGSGYYIAAMREALDGILFREVQPELDIRISKLGGNASLYGIATIAADRAISTLIQSIVGA